MLNFIRAWKIELGLALALLCVAVFSPVAVQAECAPGDTMHYHCGANHCDTGGTSCYNVCG